jgi:multimeric flavodoxin WrbA
MGSFLSYDDVLEFIYKLGGDQKISNSEALVLAAMYGAREVGLKTGILRLNDHLSLVGSEPKDPESLKNVMEHSTGFVMSSPVYFGDRSSLIADLIKFVREVDPRTKLSLDNKAVGMVSVGAKRNGGQETTNIYALYDCMNLGACIVGNGPPTSQYGGTGWGGKIGTIIDDNFGLNTSKGTGRRVALLSTVLNMPLKSSPIRILFVVTRADTRGKFIGKIKSLSFSNDVEVDVLDLSNLTIKRCLACPICPAGDLDKLYTCVIPPSSQAGEKDDMELIHSRLIKADCIILSHYSGADAGPDKFQVFMERTRFVRRNDFELGDRAFSAFIATSNLDDIYSLRFMTSFLRHNLFIIGPFYRLLQDPQANVSFENFSSVTFTRRVEEFTKKSRLAREARVNKFHSNYEPIGYFDSIERQE